MYIFYYYFKAQNQVAKIRVKYQQQLVTLWLWFYGGHTGLEQGEESQLEC